jgi:hypothetical protein
MPDLTREIRCEPGYDYRETDLDKPSGQRRGCHGMNMRWLLHGEHGTVQFVIYTGWLPSWVVDDGDPFGPRVDDRRARGTGPMAADLGHHWDTPTYPGEDGPRSDCHLRPSGRCFYDGSGLNAEPVFAKLLTGGHDAVWAALEEYYAQCDVSARELIA